MAAGARRALAAPAPGPAAAAGSVAGSGSGSSPSWRSSGWRSSCPGSPPPRRAGSPSSSAPTPANTSSAAPGAGSPVIVLFAAFNTVLGEELLFRGLLLPRMRGVFGRYDWVANGVLFACYHLHTPWVIPTALINVFAISYPVAALRERLDGDPRPLDPERRADRDRHRPDDRVRENPGMSEAMELDGKVALVTGASSGIGAAAARSLHEAGASVGLLSRRGGDLGLERGARPRLRHPRPRRRSARRPQSSSSATAASTSSSPTPASAPTGRSSSSTPSRSRR